jgi:CTP synthase (UTP-ammonia lyase)
MGRKSLKTRGVTLESSIMSDIRKPIQIGLIGDFNESVPAHRAIPIALELAITSNAVPLKWEWIGTEEIIGTDRLAALDGVWCVPASPYRSMEGALRAIRWARERKLPFLGTCGGFQHAVIEYARSVIGWRDAEHAETCPDAQRAVIAPLECALVEKSDKIRFEPGSKLAFAYGRLETEEGYRCRYGFNPAFRKALLSGPLKATAFDAAGEVRGVELQDHPFFVATLFQPERRALQGQVPPIALAFVRAVSLQRIPV